MDRTNSVPSPGILHSTSARRAAVGLLTCAALLLGDLTLIAGARRAVPRPRGARHASASVRTSSPNSGTAAGAKVGANVVAWQTLKAAQHVPTSYKGDPNALAKLQSGAVPLAMASADFDADGVADLVIGFAHSSGGILALHRGNLDAFAPQSYQSWVAIAHEQFPSPFLAQAAVIDVPEAPEFLVTGDFNGDGHIDILTGARGSGRLYLLLGNGKGKFSAPQAITLPGKLTALAAGEVGVRDGKSDVVAGIQTDKGASVLVYKGAAGGLSTAAVSYPVPQAATQLELADLHGDGFTDVIALATEVFVIHPTGDASADTSALVERVVAAGTPRAIAAGGLVWDRQSRNQLAVLSQSGIVQVLTMGALDARPFTAEERFARRSAALRAQLPSTLKAPWSGNSEPWNVVKSYGVSAPLTGKVRLMAVSLAHARPLDLMLVDSSDTRLHVLPANTAAGSASAAGGLMVETGAAPAAVLPMRVNVDGRRGLVMVGSSGPAPKMMAPLPDPTFTVNRFDDPVASTAPATVLTYCNGLANDCSLREAIIKANSIAGADTVMLPAGTYTLQQIGLAENFAVTGDVDVRDDLTIVGSVDGSGNPTSIIQGCGGTSGVACSGGTDWNDKFISTNKDGTTSGSLSISNVIFRNGHNTNTGSATFDYRGGAVDFFGCAAEGGGCFNVVTLPVSSLSITNVQFLNNTAAGCLAGKDCGGALDSEFGPTTVSTSTFSGNAASLGRGGALTLVGAKETMSVTNSQFQLNQSAQEGGALYIDFANTSGAGSISIHSSSFANNTAGADGGGIYVNLGSGGNTTTATIDQGTRFIGNTSATRGGGLVFNGITGTITTPGTTSLTLSKVTITGNAANGSSTGSGGGIFVASGGTLNVSFSRIAGNATAASGNPTGMSVEAGTAGSASVVNAADNWWGCNEGPTAISTRCDTVGTVNGTSPAATVSPWLFLTLNANPTAVQVVTPNNTSSLKADFLHDSAAGSVPVSNIDVLLGEPITFGARAGSISGAQTTIQPDGTAAANFTHDATCNPSSATATVDTNPPPTVTTPITTLCPDLIAGKSNSLGVSGMTTPLSSPTWTWTTNVMNGPAGTAPATFTNGQTIFTDTLPSTNVSYSNLAFNPLPNLSCGLVANLLTCSASGGDVTLGLFQGSQVSVTATAAAAGSYVNPTGGACAVDPNNDIMEFSKSNNSCSNTVVVVAPPSIAKAFNPTTIPVNGTTALTLTIANPAANTVAETGVAFSDTLPTGLVVSTPNGLTDSCGGTPVATAGSSSISLTGGTVATSSSCSVTVNVTGTASGNYTNTTGAVSSTNGGTGAPSNPATLTVANPPSINKAFGAASVPLNGTTSLSFTITNPNSGVSLSGISFTDTLPSGTVVSTPNNLSNTCNGTPTAGAGSGSVSLSGGTIAAGGTCMLSVNVTGTSAGVKNNTTGAVTSTEGGTGNTGSATLTVVTPPVISKVFSPNTIPVNGTSTLTFVIINPAANTVPQNGVAFNDTLPAGLVVASPNGLTNSCGGSASAPASGTSISLIGGTVQVNSSCTVSVNVTGTSAGAKNNISSAVTSTEGGTGNTASATLTVVAPPSIAKAFSPTTIPLNATSALTFTITNPAANTVPLNGVAFSDTLPTGLTVANATTSVCGGTLTTTASTSSIALVGATIAANSQCAFSMTVTGAASGSYTNTTGAVSSTNGGTGNTATANLVVASPPTIGKAFGATTIPLNGTTNLTLNISNPNSGLGLTGVGFTDTLPAGLVVATPNGASNTCNGTLTAAAGSSTISLSGGTVASGAACSIGVNVTGTTAGVKNNVTGVITAAESGPGATSNTATLTVVAPATIIKQFAAASVPLNGTTSLGFTINNPNGSPLTGVAFTDTLPAGLQVASVPNTSNSCGGALTAAAGAGIVSLSGGTVASSGSCAISVDVTGTTAGTKNNSTGPISSTEGGTGATSNTVSLAVVAPPSIAKAFSPTTIPLNATSALTFTITNPAANTVPLNGVAFSDTLPTGLTVANATTSVCGGTLTTTASTSSIALVGATIAANSQCAFSMTVTGAASGSYTNTTGAVSSTNGGTGNTATANLVVASPPTIMKAFGASTISVGGGTNLTFTISNPNTALSLSGISFTDALPSGVVVSTPSVVSGMCGGAVTAAAGSSSISLSGGTLAASGSCTIVVSVTGTTTGVQNNTTGAITATESGQGTTSNTATVTVLAPPTIGKAFGATSIALNGTTSLTFNLANPNAGNSLSGIGFTDTLPTGLVVATSNGVAGACGGGTISANAATKSISLTGATLGGGATCSFAVNVTGTSAGAKNNTTSAVTSTEAGSGGTASASIVVVAPPLIAKAFNPTTIPLNGTSSLTFTINNPVANSVAEAGVAFSDTLPSGLVVATPNGLTSSCGGTSTATVGSNSISLTGGTVATDSSCTISVNVTGTTFGIKNNTTGAVSSTNGGTGNTDSANLIVAGPPTISKTFGASTIPVGGSTSLTFTINNPNTSQSLSGIAFTDSLPSGLVVSNPNGLTGVCGGAVTAAAGSGSISLSGGTLAASGSCIIVVNVTGTTAGVKTNTTGAISATETGPGATSNTATLTVLAPPTIGKAFGTTSIALNGTTSLTFNVSNPNGNSSLSGIGFTDTLPSGLVVATPNGLTGSCGGGAITATAGANGLSLMGATLAASATCSFAVNVTGTNAGTKNNTTGAVTSAEAGNGGMASASMVVVAPPSIAKAFGATNIPVNGTTSLTLTITNPNTGTALSGVSVTDSFPSGLHVAATPSASNTCGGTFTATAGSTSISLSGGTVAANGSCAVSVNVTPMTSGSKLNTTGNVSSTNGGTGNSASATLTAGDFSISVSPTSQTIPAGHMAVYTLTLSSTAGFMGTIGLTCSGGPPNSTCTTVPSSITLASGAQMAKVTVDLNVPKVASHGTFTITFTGTSATLTHATTANLTVK